jgi:hypothetical protein
MRVIHRSKALTGFLPQGGTVCGIPYGCAIETTVPGMVTCKKCKELLRGTHTRKEGAR